MICSCCRATDGTDRAAFPLPRVDDRRVVSGIIYVTRDCLQWKDAPAGLGSPQNALQPLRLHRCCRQILASINEP